MTTVHRLPRSFMAVTRRADVLLGRCTYYEEDGGCIL